MLFPSPPTQTHSLPRLIAGNQTIRETIVPFDADCSRVAFVELQRTQWFPVVDATYPCQRQHKWILSRASYSSSTARNEIFWACQETVYPNFLFETRLLCCIGVEAQNGHDMRLKADPVEPWRTSFVSHCIPSEARSYCVWHRSMCDEQTHQEFSACSDQNKRSIVYLSDVTCLSHVLHSQDSHLSVVLNLFWLKVPDLQWQLFKPGSWACTTMRIISFRCILHLVSGRLVMWGLGPTIFSAHSVHISPAESKKLLFGQAEGTSSWKAVAPQNLSLSKNSSRSWEDQEEHMICLHWDHWQLVWANCDMEKNKFPCWLEENSNSQIILKHGALFYILQIRWNALRRTLKRNTIFLPVPSLCNTFQFYCIARGFVTRPYSPDTVMEMDACLR